ncbi:MAG: AAA family ATPase [Candidatus Bipolaricaulia bacterium]
MIERLVIHRFRGIREGILEDLGKINLLIGPNNSGKTAILEMLYLIGTSGRPCGLILETVENGNFQATAPLRYDFVGFEPLPRLRQRHGHKGRWEDSPATLTEEDGLAIFLRDVPETHPLRDFRLAAPLSEPGGKNAKAFFKKDLNTVALFSLNRQTGIPSAMIPSWFAQQKVQSESSLWSYLWQPEWVYKWEREKPIDHLAVWAVDGDPPNPQYILFFDFHTANAHFDERFVDWAYQNVPDWYEQIAESLVRIFPEINGAKVEVNDAPDGQEGKTGYIRLPGRTPLAIDHFGDGMRHAFKVLASLTACIAPVEGQPALSHEKNSRVFLWEDPELFMHPKSLGRLLGEVLDLIRDQPVQVFLCSQSIEVVGLLTHHLHEDNADLQSEFRAFRLDLEQGHLNVAKYRFPNLETWLKQEMDPRYWGVTDLPFSYRYRRTENVFTKEES